MAATDPGQPRVVQVTPNAANAPGADARRTRLEKTYIVLVMSAFWSILLLYAFCAYYVAILTFVRAHHHEVFAQLMPWSDNVDGRGSHSGMTGQLHNKSLSEVHASSNPSSLTTITNAELVPATPSTTPAGDSINNTHFNSSHNITNCGVCNGSDMDTIFSDAIDGRQSNSSSNDLISDNFPPSLLPVSAAGEGTNIGRNSASTQIVTGAPITSIETMTAVEATFSTPTMDSTADTMNGFTFENSTAATTKTSPGIDTSSFDIYGDPENYSFKTTNSRVDPSTSEEKSQIGASNNASNVILVDFTDVQLDHSNATNDEDASDMNITTAIVNRFSNDSFNVTTSTRASSYLNLPTIVGIIAEDPMNCSVSSPKCVLPSKADIPSFEPGRPTLIDRIYGLFNNSTSKTIGTSTSVNGGSDIPFTISAVFKFNTNLSSTLENTLTSTADTASAGKILLNVSDINALTNAENFSTGLSSTSADITPCKPLNRSACDIATHTTNFSVNVKPTVNINQINNWTSNATVLDNATTGAVTEDNITSAGLTQGAPFNYPSFQKAVLSLARSTRPVTVKDEQLDYSTTNATTSRLLMSFMDPPASTDTISSNNSKDSTEEISFSNGTFDVSSNTTSGNPNNTSVTSNSSTASLLSSSDTVAESTDTRSGNPNNISVALDTSGVISSSSGNVPASVNSSCGNPENISISPNSTMKGISSSGGTVSTNTNCDNPNNISVTPNTSTEDISSANGTVPESVNTSCGNPKNFAVTSKSYAGETSNSSGTVPESADNYGNSNNISASSDITSRNSPPGTDANSSGSGVVIVPVQGSVPAQPNSPRRYPTRQHVDQLLWEMRPPSRYRP